MKLGHMPFPTPFYFPDGQACLNFNQLVLACDSRWEEARGLLADGIWPTFFGGMGRLDLAAAAKQAAGDPDLDHGLSLLLEKLPADPDCLRLPKAAVESAEENLGQLTPGVDLGFELVILNKGMFLLCGVVSSNADWLVFGDHAGPAQKMFQTRNRCAIAVRVLGSKLRAGLKPLQGEIIIDSNGGSLVVPVLANVPVVPFPKGEELVHLLDNCILVHGNDALAGARSPREIALKAKEHPNEAAILFAASAVKAWYAMNGWTYPIEGSEGSGKGAVQQFFEALGLTKPPRLAIDPQVLTFNGKVGERLTKRVTISTNEAKPVYAQAWSDEDLVKFGPIKYLGNKVKITVEVTVPPRPGETVQVQITIQGNGKQQFVVPVNITVDNAPAVGKKPTHAVVSDATLISLPAKPKPPPAPAAVAEEEDAKETWGEWFSRLWKRIG